MHDSPPTPVKPVSVHRAFVYSASLPGLGEFYAGHRIRGLMTGVLFLTTLVWFSGALFFIVNVLIDQFLARFQGNFPAQLPELPLFAMAVAFGMLYLLWLWTIISAVDTAVHYRRRYRLPEQTSVAWAVAISWICPGAGHLYTGSRRYGYMLFGAHLLALVVMVPAYLQLFKGLFALVNSSNLSPNNPYQIIDIIHGLMVRLDFSFGSICQGAIKYIAIAGTVAELAQKARKEDRRWTRPSMPYGAALIGLGWLCPGSGQLLQKRLHLGWSILAVYIGSKCLTGLLLGNDLIAVGTADRLAWFSIIIQWGAMLEAVLRMSRSGKKRNVDSTEDRRPGFEF